MNQSRQFIVNGSAHGIPLPDGMIHTVVTSPPYFSLRKYQGQQEVDWPAVHYTMMSGGPYGGPTMRIEPMRCALGLEPTPEAYIGHLVLCFREVWRVLRDDGVVWCVMGDSYAGSGDRSSGGKGFEHMQGKEQKAPDREIGLQQGDLMLIPHRLALALQGDGWIVRNDVVWAKVAPMPESVSGWRWERCRVKVMPSQKRNQIADGLPDDEAGRRDAPNFRDGYTEASAAQWHPCPGCARCADHGGYVLRRGSWRHTRAHETVLMLAKGMGYFADQERVREALIKGAAGSLFTAGKTGENMGDRVSQLPRSDNDSGRNPRSVLAADELDELWEMFTDWLVDDNPPDVLTPSPESYGRNHYAVFPRSLIAPLLRATAPTRVCPVCQAPWCPVVEQIGTIQDRWSATNALASDVGGIHAERTTRRQLSTLAHRPTCTCIRDDWQPGWCLDPFVGSGTTLEVCAELGVNAIGLDISHEYLDDHAKPRIGLTPAKALEGLPLFEGIDP